MAEEWLLGVLLCLAGAALTNLGLTLQKLAFIRIDALQLPAHERPSFLTPLWLLGLLIFLVGQCGGMVAMGFSSQSVVATLGSFSLVTNAVFAPLILKEQLTSSLLVSIVIIIAGSIIVVLSSNHGKQDYTLQQLLALFRRDLFTVYLAVLSLCLAVCLYFMIREHRRWKQQAKDSRADNSAAAASAAADPVVSDGESINVSVSLPPSPRKPLLSASPSEVSSPSPTSPASLSSLTPTLTAAILSSISVLLGKCTMQLIKTSATTANQFSSPFSFIISAVFIVAAVASVHLLNVGLRRGTALFVVPFYYVSSTSLAIVGGLVYFEEFSSFSLLQCVVFFSGVALTVLGVWISTRGQMEEEEREAEEEEQQAEAELEAEEEEQQQQQLEQERMKQDEQKAAPPRSPSSSSSSSIPSPRAFTPRHASIIEEPAAATEGGTGMAVSSDGEDTADEERESAKRRAWHAKRAVSEPSMSFILSPAKGDMSGDRYGTFSSQTAAAAASSSLSSSASDSDSSLSVPSSITPPHPPAASFRYSRALSMSAGEPAARVLPPHLRLRSPRQTRSGLASRRAYTPHYTLAFYPLLPSNPASVKRKSRSASVAASRQLSPHATPIRRLRL